MMISKQPVVVTPALAREFLANSANIRKIVEAHVAFLTDQILSGRWVVNGETIKFDHLGRLIDGQHRLMACIRAGVPIETYVVWGVTDQGVDEGRIRQIGDLLGGKGVRNYVATAAVTRNLYLLSDGRDPWTSGRNKRVSNSELLGFSEALDQERLTRAVAAGCAVRTLAATSVTGVVAYQAGANDAAIAVHSFFDDMMSGAGLKEGSPQLELRRRLEANRAKKRTGPTWNRAVYVMMVRAWNYYANGNHRITGQALCAQMHAVELPTVATVVRRPSVT